MQYKTRLDCSVFVLLRPPVAQHLIYFGAQRYPARPTGPSDTSSAQLRKVFRDAPLLQYLFY